ncbi:MAG: hypothetical protein J2P18_09815 [Nocardia sp.]|nr:hypothetical protein [Nocardia sp.]
MTGVSTAPDIHPDAPLRAALRYGVVGVCVLLVVSVPAGSLIAGWPGFWGAVIGSAIGGFFILTTAALVLFSARLDSGIQGMVMLAGWIGKLLVVMVVVAIVHQFDFYSPGALFLTVVGALLVVLGAETVGLLRRRVPTVDSPAGPADHDNFQV